TGCAAYAAQLGDAAVLRAPYRSRDRCRGIEDVLIKARLVARLIDRLGKEMDIVVALDVIGIRLSQAHYARVIPSSARSRASFSPRQSVSPLSIETLGSLRIRLGQQTLRRVIRSDWRDARCL